MASGATYTPIATQTLASAAASVTFSSISSAYTDLVLVENYSLSTLSQSVLTFNGSGSGYSNTNLYGNGSSATSTKYTGVGGLGRSPGVGDNANQMNAVIRSIQNYNNTTTYKTVIQRRNDATASVWASVGLWSNTAAITSITLTTSGGNYNAGSQFTLYGIAAA